MISKAQWKYVRISPRKLRLVADVVRGRGVQEAMAMLRFINKKAAPILYKVLKSALSNAMTREDVRVKEDELFVSRLMINDAPRMKRWRAISRGRAAPYVHRYSHIMVELDKTEE